MFNLKNLSVMIYIECADHIKFDLKKKYPNAIFVLKESDLYVFPGIKEALHNVTAPQYGMNWKVLSNGYYHSVVEVFD